MKKRMKRITALALAAMMTFSLAACGSNGKDADDAGKSKDGKTTIKITWWGGQSRHDYTQKLLDAYEESHPDIEFEALPVDGTDILKSCPHRRHRVLCRISYRWITCYSHICKE
ncbi:MAG: hypothetical protein ACLTDB_06830 [[Ruminococcus] torques]